MRGDKFWKVRLSLCSSLLSRFVRVKNIPFRPVWPGPATQDLLSLWSTRAPSILNSYASYFGKLKPFHKHFLPDYAIIDQWEVCLGYVGQWEVMRCHSEWLLSGVSTNITFLISDLQSPALPGSRSLDALSSRLTHLFKIVRPDKWLSQVSSL